KNWSVSFGGGSAPRSASWQTCAARGSTGRRSRRRWAAPPRRGASSWPGPSNGSPRNSDWTRTTMTETDLDSPDPATHLERLWQRGGRPDVRQFLSAAAGLTPAQVVAVLCVDQRERWRAGERVLAETYLQIPAAHQADFEDILELIYREFLLRETRGESPDPDEYLRRFPEYAPR